MIQFSGLKFKEIDLEILVHQTSTEIVLNSDIPYRGITKPSTIVCYPVEGLTFQKPNITSNFDRKILQFNGVLVQG